MGEMKKSRRRDGLIIEYRALGTINIDELIHALIEDLKTLKDVYNVRYVTAARLKVPATNEYGERIRVRRPGGGTLHRIDTLHFRPACLDYEL